MITCSWNKFNLWLPIIILVIKTYIHPSLDLFDLEFTLHISYAIRFDLIGLYQVPVHPLEQYVAAAYSNRGV